MLSITVGAIMVIALGVYIGMMGYLYTKQRLKKPKDDGRSVCYRCGQSFGSKKNPWDKPSARTVCDSCAGR